MALKLRRRVRRFTNVSLSARSLAWYPDALRTGADSFKRVLGVRITVALPPLSEGRFERQREIGLKGALHSAEECEHIIPSVWPTGEFGVRREQKHDVARSLYTSAQYDVVALASLRRREIEMDLDIGLERIH